VGRNEADRSTGLIKENTRRKWAEQRPYCPESRRRDGGAPTIKRL